MCIQCFIVAQDQKMHFELHMVFYCYVESCSFQPQPSELPQSCVYLSPWSVVVADL